MNLPPGYYIRTLVDRTKGLYKDCDPDHFCDRTSQGTPFYSEHVIWQVDDMWIGSICRDMPGDDWQIYLIDLENPRGAWEEFQDAIDQLFKWHKERQAYKESHAYRSELATLRPETIEPVATKKRRSTRKKSA